MAEKKKGRRAYLNDIKKDRDGRYVYEGTLYLWKEDRESRKGSLQKLWVCCGILMAAVLAAGSIPAPGMSGCFYLVLPYAVQVIAAVSVCWGLGRLSIGGSPLREYVYEAAAKKLPGRAAVTAAASLLTAIGEIIYIFTNAGQENAGMAILLILLETAASASALFLRKIVRGLSWEIKKGK